MEDQLTPEERLLLLTIARQAVQAAACGELLPLLSIKTLPPRLQIPGASFVTLTRKNGELRGCIGALEVYLPLAKDVQEHAVAAALHDYRFPPLQSFELSDLVIEISRLTLPRAMAYECPEDLVKALRPGVDGVVVRDGVYRATFLPQVWAKLPEPEAFLGHLCQKMGAPADLWRFKPLQVLTYQVEEFHE